MLLISSLNVAQTMPSANIWCSKSKLVVLSEKSYDLCICVFPVGAMIGSGFGGCGYSFSVSGAEPGSRMLANANSRTLKHNFLFDNRKWSS